MSDLKLTTIYLNTFENFVSSVLLQPVTWIEISRKNISCFDGIGNRISWRWSFLERGQFRFFLCSLCLDFLVGRLSIRFVAQIQSRVVVPYLWLCIFLENVLRTEKIWQNTSASLFRCFWMSLLIHLGVADIFPSWTNLNVYHDRSRDFGQPGIILAHDWMQKCLANSGSTFKGCFAFKLQRLRYNRWFPSSLF